jgi:hypothetical protein
MCPLNGRMVVSITCLTFSLNDITPTYHATHSFLKQSWSHACTSRARAHTQKWIIRISWRFWGYYSYIILFGMWDRHIPLLHRTLIRLCLLMTVRPNAEFYIFFQNKELKRVNFAWIYKSYHTNLETFYNATNSLCTICQTKLPKEFWSQYSHPTKPLQRYAFLLVNIHANSF